jgi:hypothetical protein
MAILGLRAQSETNNPMRINMLQLIHNEDYEGKAEAEPAFHDAIQRMY